MTRARTKRPSREYSNRLMFGIAATAAALLAAPAAHAQFASAIGLGSLTPTTGMRIFGTAIGEEAGGFLAAGGDINGDGLGDILVSAATASPNGTQSGAIYVVFGTRLLPAAPLLVSALDGTNGFRIAGRKAGDLTGFGISGGGDINGDGFDDIVIGAPFSDQQGTSTGTAYVVFGKAKGFKPTLQLTALNGNNGFRIDGRNAGDYFGDTVSLAGDINGDGLDDMVFGAFGADTNGSLSGSAYVVFGRKAGWKPRFKLADLNGKNGFRLNGAITQDITGSVVSAAGDFNGDGFADILVGSRNADIGGGVRRGTVHLMFGKAGGFNKSINVTSLTGAKGFRMEGVATLDEAGTVAASAGDINGDGLDDIALGAPEAVLSGAETGAAYVVFGRASAVTSPLELDTLDGVTGFRLDGTAFGEETGSAVGGVSDVNGDGFADVIVGSESNDQAANNAGATHVVFGKSAAFAPSLLLATLPVAEGFRLDGENASDISGGAVAGVGDFNGDGFGDVLVGAGEAEPNGVYSAGVAYLVLGRAPETFVIRGGSAADQYISGGPGPDTLVGLDGNDILEARGGPIDTMIGGTGKDTASYKHADGPVVANLSDNSANTGDATEDVYDTIERLEGSRFNDVLTGDAQDNFITGGKGKDKLRGKGGRDRFVVTAVTDSLDGASTRDNIFDFNPGKASTVKDVLDLRGVDAKTGQRGNQKFKFIGTAAFSGAKGELRLKKISAGIIVQGDTNGNQQPDFEILLKGLGNTAKFTAKDFKL